MKQLTPCVTYVPQESGVLLHVQALTGGWVPAQILSGLKHMTGLSYASAPEHIRHSLEARSVSATLNSERKIFPLLGGQASWKWDGRDP